ncbi:MAG: hypothetical protein LC641_00750 [Spirochaeta sp.]|nr:hypothetical protein [Spirochaeta sp.]
MSIQPIDLQTLFSHLGNVGKTQSAEAQALAQQQAVAGREIARRSAEQESSVNEASTVEEGPEKSNEDGKGSSQHHESGREEDAQA